MSPTPSLLDFPEDCEQSAITKLIKIVQTALQCDNGPGLDEKETKFASKILNTLLDSFNSTMQEVIGEDGEVNFGEPTYSPVTPTQRAMQIITTTTISPGKTRVHKLELVKVGVLVVVISIIMLTTCRMVFQIFARFKPEKPQMH